jgi:anti-anti-sigma regulatory factor
VASDRGVEPGLALVQPEAALAELEILFGNAGDVAVRLRAAIAPGVSVVVADLTTTAFCDSSGVRIMLLARDWASADNVELRLAAPPGPTLVVLKLVALDELLAIYPSLEEALAGEPVLDADVPRG